MGIGGEKACVGQPVFVRGDRDQRLVAIAGDGKIVGRSVNMGVADALLAKVSAALYSIGV